MGKWLATVRSGKCRFLMRSNLRQMPLCKPATEGVMDALLRDGEDTLFREEELLDRAISKRMSTVRGVALEMRAIE